MTKRVFDIIVALALLMLLFPLIVFVSLLIFLRDGRPVFYVSERMKSQGEGFVLLKFRTKCGHHVTQLLLCAQRGKIFRCDDVA